MTLQNVLITSNGAWKLAGFGFAIPVDQTSSDMTAMQTFHYSVSSTSTGCLLNFKRYKICWMEPLSGSCDLKRRSSLFDMELSIYMHFHSFMIYSLCNPVPLVCKKERKKILFQFHAPAFSLVINFTSLLVCFVSMNTGRCFYPHVNGQASQRPIIFTLYTDFAHTIL